MYRDDVCDRRMWFSQLLRERTCLARHWPSFANIELVETVNSVSVSGFCRRKRVIEEAMSSMHLSEPVELRLFIAWICRFTDQRRRVTRLYARHSRTSRHVWSNTSFFSTIQYNPHFIQVNSLLHNFSFPSSLPTFLPFASLRRNFDTTTDDALHTIASRINVAFTHDFDRQHSTNMTTACIYTRWPKK